MKFLFSTLSTMLAMAAPSLAFVQPTLPVQVRYDHMDSVEFISGFYFLVL